MHAEASEVAEGLRRLQTEDKRTSKDRVELEAVVKGVQVGLLDAAKGIERNWESLESRMSGLEERLSALHE